jgi:hypothetical protein
MNIKQRAVIGVVAVLAFVYFTNFDEFSSSGLTNDEVQDIIEHTTESFIKAEKEVLDNDPTPPDPVIPSGPDPDPKKCICKGTGKIVQGDGHVSSCPYHGTNGLKPGPNTRNTFNSQRGVFGGRLFGR